MGRHLSKVQAFPHIRFNWLSIVPVVISRVKKNSVEQLYKYISRFKINKALNDYAADKKACLMCAIYKHALALQFLSLKILVRTAIPFFARTKKRKRKKRRRRSPNYFGRAIKLRSQRISFGPLKLLSLLYRCMSHDQILSFDFSSEKASLSEEMFFIKTSAEYTK